MRRLRNDLLLPRLGVRQRCQGETNENGAMGLILKNQVFSSPAVLAVLVHKVFR
jgi:hypothetical protein